jgi:hypothetical protein
VDSANDKRGLVISIFIFMYHICIYISCIIHTLSLTHTHTLTHSLSLSHTHIHTSYSYHNHIYRTHSNPHSQSLALYDTLAIPLQSLRPSSLFDFSVPHTQPSILHPPFPAATILLLSTRTRGADPHLPRSPPPPRCAGALRNKKRILIKKQHLGGRGGGSLGCADLYP